MKKIIIVSLLMLSGLLVTGCAGLGQAETSTPTQPGSTGHPAELSDIKTEDGKKISVADVTDFYYTYYNMNFNAEYIRYRFYVEDGKGMFFYERRERPNDYGPLEEEDITETVTRELSEEEWAEFWALIQNGSVSRRVDNAESGDSGPWMYIYWRGDEETNQVYEFASYEERLVFEEYCESLSK